MADYENARGRDQYGQPIPPAPGDTDKDRIAQLKAAALGQNPNMKFIISLGWGHNDFSLGASNPEQFAASVAQIVDENGLDGFDIDYESDYITTQAFQDVSRALRTALDSLSQDQHSKCYGKKLYLIITPNSASLDAGTINTYYDYVQMQSYDYVHDAYCDPNDFLTAGVTRSKLLFGRDIENGDTLTCTRYGGVGNVADFVRNNGLGGIMGWRVNSSSQMQSNFAEVIALGNAFGTR